MAGAEATATIEAGSSHFGHNLEEHLKVGWASDPIRGTPIGPHTLLFSK